MTILDDIRKSDEIKRKIASDSLASISKLLTAKSSDYGPVSEILDLAFALTGYMNAAIPGGEVQACARCLSKIIRYMTLRTNELVEGKVPNTESLEDSMIDFLGEAARLIAEVKANRPQLKSKGE